MACTLIRSLNIGYVFLKGQICLSWVEQRISCSKQKRLSLLVLLFALIFYSPSAFLLLGFVPHPRPLLALPAVAGFPGMHFPDKLGFFNLLIPLFWEGFILHCLVDWVELSDLQSFIMFPPPVPYLMCHMYPRLCGPVDSAGIDYSCALRWLARCICIPRWCGSVV